MIQRVQSLYLLLVAVLMAVTFFSPLLGLKSIDLSTLVMYSEGIFSAGKLIKPTWGVISIAGMSALVAFINIFLFKKRKLQIKVGFITSFLIVFFYITLFTYFYVYTNQNGLELNSAYYGVILPVIALILNFLAIRKIKSDEKLVRSLDRIR